MTTKQQAEALQYFRDFAGDWARKARSTTEERVNVVQQRNDYALAVVDQRPATRRVLDVGCGTGELVHACARRGLDAVGVDFADKMIVHARAAAEALGLAQARFVCASIFDFELAPGEYDVIIGNGLIEYLSYPELDQLLELAHRALSSQGSLVLGSRNRLYNLFSLNSYTAAELDGGHAERLLAEALALASPGPLSALAGLEPAPLQPAESRHPDTGIAVQTRFQFTPVQLMHRLGEHGFQTQALHPIHVHAVPPAMKAELPVLHTGLSNLLHPYAGQHRALLPFASSFMVHAVKD